VQTWLYHADLLGGLAARFARSIPVVWGIHHTPSRADSMRSATRLVLRMNAMLSGTIPRRIVCCSESALDAHARRGYRRERMLVIHNGVDATRFRPDAEARAAVRRELGLPPEAKLIGMFARFHPQKDHGAFIEAAGRVLQEQPRLHVVLAGDGGRLGTQYSEG
jgi:glycosyltransferase involved in cell wall biosynthesis